MILVRRSVREGHAGFFEEKHVAYGLITREELDEALIAIAENAEPDYYGVITSLGEIPDDEINLLCEAVVEKAAAVIP